MINSYLCSALPCALDKLKEIVIKNEQEKQNTLIFCEDRLTLAAERIVCSAVGGTIRTGVYTFARFMADQAGKREGVLSSQGSAMAIRRIIEENKSKLQLFGKFAASSSASSVYDSIALMYASKISPKDLQKASAKGLLQSKLKDVALIYSEYEKYLSEKGFTDSNAYLATLSDVIEKSEKIKKSHVIFLGFQSFTRAVCEGVRSAMRNAISVSGLFIGGSEAIYVNEAEPKFCAVAIEEGAPPKREKVADVLSKEADLLRVGLFDADSFKNTEKLATDKVRVFSAADEDEELEFIAAMIKKYILSGEERYAKISLMLPDAAGAERDIRRVFSEFDIPYFIDRRIKLSAHPICAFIINYLECVASGCAPVDADRVISSPLFPAERADKDEFRNYALRLAAFRGGVKREPKKEILEAKGFAYDGVIRVRSKFMEGLSCLSAANDAIAVCRGVRKLLTAFGAEDKLNKCRELFKDDFPTEAEFGVRAYEGVLSVLDECEEIGGAAPFKEIVKILASGFEAYEISVIPPKADAVFVGDIASTANTGSDIVFAARLTFDVPMTSMDEALLTDRDITELKNADIDLSPKIRQVNLRRYEYTALNICAFRKALYLSYPLRLAGEEVMPSEILEYARAVFTTLRGDNLLPVPIAKVIKSYKSVPYYCSELTPALKTLAKTSVPEVASSVFEVLVKNGYSAEAQLIQKPDEKWGISCGLKLFAGYGSISPTALETYFSCPYKNFMQYGLKLKEREEGAFRPLDTGNLIHSVLQILSGEINSLSAYDAAERAKEIAQDLMSTPQYASLSDSKRGEYTAKIIKEEVGEIAKGIKEHLEKSNFRISAVEMKCLLDIGSGFTVGGRIDRIDSCGDMVRIIDYKTGTIEISATKYYMGLKLQLPLYLTAASVGAEATGAFYFPASVEYKEKADGYFKMSGFMDGSDEVVTNMEKDLKIKDKGRYIPAVRGGKTDNTMEAETFKDFLKYSVLVSRGAAFEMAEGNVTPSPSEGACAYCNMGGSCGFAVGRDGAERKADTLKCSDIAKIVRGEKG